MGAALVRSEIALVVDLAADIAPDNLSHTSFSLRSWSGCARPKNLRADSSALVRCGLLVAKAILSMAELTPN